VADLNERVVGSSAPLSMAVAAGRDLSLGNDSDVDVVVIKETE
jgi:hypothetical protein